MLSADVFKCQMKAGDFTSQVFDWRCVMWIHSCQIPLRCASYSLRVAALNMCGSVVSVWFPSPLISSSSSWEMQALSIGFYPNALVLTRLISLNANSACYKARDVFLKWRQRWKQRFPFAGSIKNTAYEAVLISVCLSLALVHNWNE